MKKTVAKEWTFMVYLAGDNNLDGAGVADLEEMKEVGSTEQVNIIAQFDRQGDEQETRRYYLTKKGSLEQNAVGDGLGETNMGDPNILQSFLLWGIEKYPANHYVVVLWNHGNGWNDEDIYRAARKLNIGIHRKKRVIAAAGEDTGKSMSVRRMRVMTGQKFRRALFRTSVEAGIKNRGIAYDDNARDFLDNLELKSVLASIAGTLGRKIDVLGMDACLMSMAEVGFQFRDTVSVTVGSEQTEPGDGWPYDRILAKLINQPAMTPEELSKIIVDEYLDSYDSNSGVTQSACALNMCGQLAAAVDKLSKCLISGLSNTACRSEIVETVLQVQRYEVRDYIDLNDFCDLLIVNCGTPDIRTAADDVIKATKSQYVLSSGYKGSEMSHSSGVSIYFPEDKISNLYSTLDFSQTTSWPKFLEEYQQSIRRPR
jgi:hypothetical protein